MLQYKFQLFSMVSILLCGHFAKKHNNDDSDKNSFKRNSMLSIILAGSFIFLLPF